MSNSVRPQRRQPTRLPRPWDSPGKNTGVGCHFLPQCMKLKSESEVAQSCPTLATPWTAAHRAPPSMGFSMQKYWSGVPLPSLQTSLDLPSSSQLPSFLYFSLCPFLCLPHASQMALHILPSPHRYSLPFLCFLPLCDAFSLITSTPFLCDFLSLHQFVLVKEITCLCTDVFLVVAVRLKPVAPNGVILTLRGIWRCPETVSVAITGVGLLPASAREAPVMMLNILQCTE